MNTTTFTKNLTRATMVLAVAAAGVSIQPARAADASTQTVQAVQVVQLPTVTVVGKRIPVIQLERVVVVAKRQPAATVVAQRGARTAAI